MHKVAIVVTTYTDGEYPDIKAKITKNSSKKPHLSHE